MPPTKHSYTMGWTKGGTGQLPHARALIGSSNGLKPNPSSPDQSESPVLSWCVRTLVRARHRCLCPQIQLAPSYSHKPHTPHLLARQAGADETTAPPSTRPPPPAGIGKRPVPLSHRLLRVLPESARTHRRRSPRMAVRDLDEIPNPIKPSPRNGLIESPNSRLCILPP